MIHYVWILQDLDTGAEHWFYSEHIAMHNAERIVGNNAVGGDREFKLYGPGNGTTRVMVRKFTREEARMMWPDLGIPGE
jgi:hypothetical protein